MKYRSTCLLFYCLDRNIDSALCCVTTMNASISQMDYSAEEKLIFAVRDYPELYDPKHRHYYDIAHRDRLWEKISESFQEESAVVKKKWSYLRDCYRKCLKKRKRGELGRIPNKQWKYEKEMSFLHDHFWFGKTKSTEEQGQTGDEDRPVSEKSLQDTSEFSDLEIDRDFMNDDDQDPFEETETFFVKTEPLAVAKPLGKQSESIPAKKQKVLHSAASSSTALPSCLFSGNDQPEVPAPDNLSSFFKYMEETVRTFPPLLQIEVKSKFAQILTEFEMKNLMSQH